MSDTLIARLEQAEEGSRELDIEIHTVVWPDKTTPRHTPPELPASFGQDAVSLEMHDALHYTTSLDDARTLVPEGMERHDFEMSRSVRGEKDWEFWTLWQVRLAIDAADYDEDETSGQYIGCASTPALALCIANLKAKEAVDKS